jgi:hypothetical protein
MWYCGVLMYLLGVLKDNVYPPPIRSSSFDTLYNCLSSRHRSQSLGSASLSLETMVQGRRASLDRGRGGETL